MPVPSKSAHNCGGPTARRNASYRKRTTGARWLDSTRVTDAVINLEAGYWGVMASPVREAFVRQVERVNRDNSFYAALKSMV